MEDPVIACYDEIKYPTLKWVHIIHFVYSKEEPSNLHKTAHLVITANRNSTNLTSLKGQFTN